AWGPLDVSALTARSARRFAPVPSGPRRQPQARLLMFVSPVENALAPHVDVAGEQDQEEEDQLHEPGPAQLANRHRPRIQEGDFDVEEQEDHRDQVELDGMALAGVAHRRHAALVRCEFFGGRTPRADQQAEPDVDRAEAGAEADHYEYGKPALHRYSTEGPRPSDSPTRSLARRGPPSLLRSAAGQAAGSLRLRG